MAEPFDFAILGGGSAGAVLASASRKTPRVGSP